MLLYERPLVMMTPSALQNLPFYGTSAAVAALAGVVAYDFYSIQPAGEDYSQYRQWASHLFEYVNYPPSVGHNTGSS